MVIVLVEDINDIIFFFEFEEEMKEKFWDYGDVEISQCVLFIDFGGEKIYRVVEGCESGLRNDFFLKILRKSFYFRGFFIMINYVIFEKLIKILKLLWKKNSYLCVCFIFVGKDVMVEEIKDVDCNSFWLLDESFSILCVGDSLMEKSEFLFF